MYKVHVFQSSSEACGFWTVRAPLLWPCFCGLDTSIALEQNQTFVYRQNLQYRGWSRLRCQQISLVMTNDHSLYKKSGRFPYAGFITHIWKAIELVMDHSKNSGPVSGKIQYVARRFPVRKLNRRKYVTGERLSLRKVTGWRIIEIFCARQVGRKYTWRVTRSTLIRKWIPSRKHGNALQKGCNRP